MINHLIFNGISSLDYDLYVSGDKTFSGAEKDFETVSVPGRSGDLLHYNGRYKNREQQYTAVLFEDYVDNVDAIKEWLMGPDDYCRLEDTYHPDEFRMAYYSGPIDFETILLSAGEVTLSFNCKPQRWLKSGENPIEFDKLQNGISISDNIWTSNPESALKNPTIFEAKPLIEVTGYGTFTIDECEITIDQLAEHLFIDCELLDCYDGITNKNPNVTIPKWPSIKKNHDARPINIDNTITSIKVTPRWWRV